MHRALLISTAGGLFFAAFFLASPQWAELIYRLIVEGFHVIAWLAAATGIGAVVLRAMRVRIESRALAFATFAGLGLGIISLLVLGMGLVGWMNRGSAIAMLVIGLIAGAMCVRNIQIELPREAAFLLLLMPTLGLVTAAAFMLPGVLWSDEPAGYDVLAYHFQVPREWYEIGRIVPLTHNVFSYFPFNVEMHYLLAMHLRGGAYEGMYLAQLMHVAFLGLSVVALIGFTAKPQTGIIAAITMGSFPWLMMLSPIGYNEGGLLLFGTLAFVWAIRAFDPSLGTPGEGAGEGSASTPVEEPSPDPLPEYQEREAGVVIAGVMTGFACGCKLTAVPVLLLAMPIIGLILRRFSVKQAATFLAISLLTLSPWLIRNQIWAGNPVFPEATQVLGQAHFNDAQVARWADAHQPSLGSAPRVRAIWEQLFRNWRWGYVPVPLSLIAIMLAWRRREVMFLAVLLLIQFILWISATHVQGRFLILTAPMAALLIAHVDVRRWFCFALGSSIASTIVGWVFLYRIMFSFPLTIGVENFEPVMRASILPDDVARQVYETDRPIVLVGDAKAFMYSIPMSRLHYRSVFDVVDWIDPSVPTDAVIVLDPVELRRLSKTYSNLPPFPPGTEDRQQPFILPR